MIYLIFLIASLFVCFFVTVFMNFVDAYLSGPNCNPLNGYLGISELVLYVILQIWLVYLFRFHKSNKGLIMSIIVLCSLSMTIILLYIR